MKRISLNENWMFAKLPEGTLPEGRENLSMDAI